MVCMCACPQAMVNVTKNLNEEYRRAMGPLPSRTMVVFWPWAGELRKTRLFGCVSNDDGRLPVDEVRLEHEVAAAVAVLGGVCVLLVLGGVVGTCSLLYS